METAIRLTLADTFWDLQLPEDMERNLRRARDLPGTEAQIAEACELAGLLHMHRSRYEDAEREMRRAVEVARGLAEEDHDHLVGALSGLGMALGRLGRYEESVASHREAVSIARTLPSGQEQLLIRALNHLNNPLCQLQRYEEAEAVLREAMSLVRRDGGPEHPWYANCCYNLAQVLSYKMEHEDGLVLLEEALEANRKRLPENHPWIAWCLESLGAFQQQVGKFDLAEKFLTEALEVRRRGSGGDTPETLLAMRGLADLACERGDNKRARQLYQTVLETCERVHGAAHLETCRVKLAMAGCLTGLELFQEAKDLLIETLADARKCVGNDHRIVAHLLASLGNTCRNLYDFDGAESYCRDALELRESTLPAGHPELAGSLLSLGSILMGRAKREEALTLFERAERIQRSHYGNDHHVLASTLHHKSWLLRQMKDPARAVPPLEEACAILTRTFGAKNPGVLNAKHDLASLYMQVGNRASALRLCDEYFAVADRTHRLRANMLGVLAVARMEAGEFREAESALREAVGIVKETRRGSWSIWTFVSRLGECLAGQKRFEEAEPHLLDSYTKMNPPNAPYPRQKKREALQRVVSLYEAWGKPEEAEKWRAKLPTGTGKGGGDGR